MSMANLGAHWWVILIIVVLLFGAPKLPALARSMGQSMRIFKNEIKSDRDADVAAPAAPAAQAAPVAPTPTVPAPTVAPVVTRTETNETGDPAAKP
jgi:sec-independent protein translocase protein TatA